MNSHRQSRWISFDLEAVAVAALPILLAIWVYGEYRGKIRQIEERLDRLEGKVTSG